MSEELLMGLFLCKLMQGRREGEREGLREGGNKERPIHVTHGKTHCTKDDSYCTSTMQQSYQRIPADKIPIGEAPVKSQ